MVEISAVDSTLINKAQSLYTKSGSQYLIPYPGSNKKTCTLISVSLPKGAYRIEC